MNQKICVSEVGNLSGWSYRKWSNNDIELWWNAVVSYTEGPVSGGIGVEPEILYIAYTTLQLPFSVADGVVTASIMWGYTDWVQVSFETADRIQIRKFGNINSMNNPNQKTYIYIRGVLG